MQANQLLTASLLTAVGPYAPVAVEQYNDEQRRYFDTDRPDKLNMRIVSPKEDHRFYLPGRPDCIKEVRLHRTLPFANTEGSPSVTAEQDAQGTSSSTKTAELLSSPSSSSSSSLAVVLPLEVTFSAGRTSEGALSYKRLCPAESPQHMSYVLTFQPQNSSSSSTSSGSSCNADSNGYPFLEIALTLQAKQIIDVPYGDSAASLWRERKILHLSVKYDGAQPGPGGAREVYQDHANHSMRITLEDPVTLLPQIVEFDNQIPNNSDLYESNKIALLAALRVLVQMEREMYVRVSMDPDSVVEERERIAKLTLSLFDSADHMTRQPAPI